MLFSPLPSRLRLPSPFRLESPAGSRLSSRLDISLATQSTNLTTTPPPLTFSPTIINPTTLHRVNPLQIPSLVSNPGPKNRYGREGLKSRSGTEKQTRTLPARSRGRYILSGHSDVSWGGEVAEGHRREMETTRYGGEGWTLVQARFDVRRLNMRPAAPNTSLAAPMAHP